MYERENLDPEYGTQIERTMDGDGFGARDCTCLIRNGQANFHRMNWRAVSLSIRSGGERGKFCRRACDAAAMVWSARQAGQCRDDGHHLITFQLRAAMMVAVLVGSCSCGGDGGSRQVYDPREQRNRRDQRNEP
jgi:hypothetical protein